MEAKLLANVRVLVAALFVTFATLGPVSSQVYAVVAITPVKPIATPPVCGRGAPPQHYVFNFKTPEHYRYEVKGQKLVSGASFPANGQTVTITAVPDNGYTFGKATASWEYTLTPVRCGG